MTTTGDRRFDARVAVVAEVGADAAAARGAPPADVVLDAVTVGCLVPPHEHRAVVAARGDHAAVVRGEARAAHLRAVPLEPGFWPRMSFFVHWVRSAVRCDSLNFTFMRPLRPSTSS